MLVALVASIGTANAQQAPDPRVADLVEAGKVQVGLFSTQYTRETKVLSRATALISREHGYHS